MKPIFLCGFMGCGKSTVGLEIAKILGCDFVDLDNYIEKNAEMTIPDIFDKLGEKHFRMLEKQALKDFSNRQSVIATGGGALIPAENAKIASEKGCVIYIKVPFEKCYDRIKNSANRPIVSRSSKQQLEELYESRIAIYSAHSTMTINGENLPFAVAKEIVQALKFNRKNI